MKKGKIMTTMATFTAGAVTGMMLAPKKGEDLREYVKFTMKKAGKKIKKAADKDILDAIGEKIESLNLEKTKKNLTRKANKIKKELEYIIEDAIERKDDIIENTATKLKEGLAKKLEDLSEEIKD